MVQTGKVVSNLMIDVNPSNVKLRDRALRILRELTGADRATAEHALEKSGWVVKKAYERLRQQGSRSPRGRGLNPIRATRDGTGAGAKTDDGTV